MKIYRSLFLFVVTVFILGATQTAIAQNPPEISRNEVRVEYPFLIRFEMFATHQRQIESVTLVYGLNGRSCQQGSARQEVDVFASSSVFAIWEWDLSQSGALPPGVTVWWQWEMVDSLGNQFTSERQEKLIEDENHDWQSARSGDVTVHWYVGNSSFGQSLLREATSSLARLDNELGLPTVEPVALWFYPAASDVRQVIFDVPEWTGGVAFPEYNVTVLGVAPGELDWAARIVPHELTHLVEGMLTFNCRGIRLPTWLSEGLARYAEGEADEAEVAQVELALQNGRLPTLLSLANGFSAFTDSASSAYTQSGQVVQYLIDTHGAAQMNTLLQTIQSGQTIDMALTTVYGLDTNSLDAAWRTAIGYEPTPTSEADAIALQATPTQVATISLGGVPLLDTPTAVPTETPLPTETRPPSATPTTLPTDTAVPNEVAQASTPSAPESKPDSNVVPEATMPVWVWWAGGGVVLLAGLVLFFRVRQRGGT